MPRYVRVLDVPIATPRVADTLAEWANLDEIIEAANGGEGSGGSVTLETPTGAVNGVNAVFVFTAPPIFVTYQKQIQDLTDDYTLVGSTVTFVQPPVSGTVKGFGVSLMPNTQILYASKTLTDAEIKALPTSGGHEMVPAPGAGKYVLFISGLVSCDTTEGIYESINGTAGAHFGLSETVYSSLQVRELTGALSDWLEFESNAFIVFPPKTNFDNGLTAPVPPSAEELDGLENVALRFWLTNSGDGDLTGGNPANSMKVTAIYTIIDV